MELTQHNAKIKAVIRNKIDLVLLELIFHPPE
jgi:hypothetical protein